MASSRLFDRSVLEAWWGESDDAPLARAAVWAGAILPVEGRREWSAALAWRGVGRRRPDHAELAQVPPGRLAVDPTGVADDVLELLGRSEVSLGTAVDLPDRGRPHTWDFPLRVTVLGSGPGVVELERVVQDCPYTRPAVGREADLLVVADSLRGAVPALVAGPSRGADLVIALGGTGGGRMASLVEAARLVVDTGGVVAVDGGDSPADLFRRILWELAHDLTLDVALHRATGGRVVSWLSDALVAAAAPRRAARRLAKRLVAVDPERKMVLPDDLRGRFERVLGPPGALPFPAVWSGAGLAATLSELGAGSFEHESDGATAIAETRAVLDEQAPEASDAPTPLAEDTPAPPRFLQGQVVRPEPEGRAAVVRGALEPRARYDLAVRVGGSDAAWIAAPEAFPEDVFRDQPEGIDVVVAFTPVPTSRDPRPRGLTRPLRVPRSGDSAEVRFPFEAPADGPFRARVTVLHGNRVLQTALFAATEDGLGVDTRALDTFQYAPDRAPFDAAIVFNDVDGDRAAYVHDGTELRVASLTGVGPAIAQLKTILDGFTVPKFGYKSIAEARLGNLLSRLAAKGRLLWDALPQSIDAARIAGPVPLRIHVVEASSSDLVPVELAYTHTAPLEDAPICPRWREGLRVGACPTACGTHDPWKQRDVVCPRAFLGLAAILERSAGPNDSRRRVHLDRCAFLATSARVDPPDAPLRPSAVLDAALQGLTSSVLRATDRPSWEAAVRGATVAPTLFVLLPHTVTVGEDGDDAMEIGDASAPMRSVDLTTLHLGAAVDSGLLVLLIGCDTAVDPVSFHTLMARFVHLRATAVLSTLSKVRGPEAAAAVARLVTALGTGRDAPGTFGEVLLKVKRALLAERDPLALTFVSFGSVDVELR